MIRAHMATYPKRRELLERSVRSVSAQVDRVFLVLNDYSDVPEEIASIDNVEPVIPPEDLKDVGKFLCQPGEDDLVLLVDDDLIYPADYVDRLVGAAKAIGLQDAVFGFHGSIYKDVDSHGANGRKVHSFNRDLSTTTCVDQLGTGCILALGKNVAPLSFMKGSQKFVDVRYARWLHQQGIQSWCVAHERDILQEMRLTTGRHETIYRDFTRNTPAHVILEIRDFAGKGHKVGQMVGLQ
ncbi:hypothetical protein [Tabrizicola sp.]|uniref:hypothetical protein n=1 Tax=Tabrizicola sp. TaxID=2005166 RepID=UPI002615699F|nr:hypothetical protein [Tabrizicola sp.]MDM7932937.1 hypothetical protein [Tabrizicola sp.]